MSSLQIAIVGYGKIAQDQHHPAITQTPGCSLVAVASRNANVDAIANFKTIEELLKSDCDFAAVALCTPAAVRTQQALLAIAKGKHVFLEKPPGATLAEVEILSQAAQAAGVTLFASWHSRFAACVESAKNWLADKTIKQVEIEWKEDVRVWHPGQAWIWQPGGMGVFDPGINALSILTAILPKPFFLTQASLDVPGNCQAPISANLTFSDINQLAIQAEFDFRQSDTPPIWQIRVETAEGQLVLDEGGSKMLIDGELVEQGENREYSNLYARFADLVAKGESEVDISPLRHVADAMMLGERRVVEDFIE